MSVLHFLRPDLASLEEYKPVKPLDVLAEEIGMASEKLIKLDANENLYGPPPEVIEAIKNAHHHIYPDPSQQHLRAQLAQLNKCKVGQIVAGAGSDDLLDIVLRLVDPEVVINCAPTFGMYSFLGKIQKAKIHDVPRTAAPAFAVDVTRVVDALRSFKTSNTRAMIFLASPNNPTGNLISEQDARAILTENVITVIDEAYVEFSDTPSLASLLPHYSNLIICRTLSKWAGLAGVRVGYSIAHEEISHKMMAIKQPYNLNTAADAAAQAILKHIDKVLRTVALLRNEKEHMFKEFETVSWLKPQRSDSNFLLVEVLPSAPLTAEVLVTSLRKRGILIRYFTNPILKSFIRVSAGRPQDTIALMAVLRTITA